MSAGQITQGRRRLEIDPETHFPPDWQPGDYWKEADGTWYGRIPNGSLSWLKNHSVTEHEDGTITVSPSILVDYGNHSFPSWHGFLERGVWREV